MILRIMLFILCLFVGSFTACSPEEATEIVEKNNVQLENGDFTAKLNGFNIHYNVYGQGPACIVLTNTWGFTSDGVRALFKSLEDHVTMVYFDPRGMGTSDDIREDSDMSMKAVREDANALRKHLELEQAIFLGWSNGAMNLLIYAAEYPETIKAAIVVHGMAWSSEEDDQKMFEDNPEIIEIYNKLFSGIRSEEMTDEDKNACVKSFMVEDLSLFLLFANREESQQILPALFQDVEFSWKHMEYSNIDQQDFDAREYLAQIIAPTLVIAGAHDLMPPDKVKDTADAIANSTFVVFENSGHYSSIEEPEKFVSTVTKFLGLPH